MTDADPLDEVPAEGLTHEQSILVERSPEEVYDLVSDIGRTGEWSPICTACWWEDPGSAGTIGAWFIGHNELPDRTWETRSQVVAAERGVEFAWMVGAGFVRWGYRLAAEGHGSRLTETWHFRPEGLRMFTEKYGDRGPAEIAARTEAARSGIPQTLAAIKRIVEGESDRPPR